MWNACPIVLASSHLARRRSRRAEVLAAKPWDVVLVDEAHHAWRRGSKPTDTPNSLLALLVEMKARGSWRTMYLASANPMQMHAHEAWDLLQLLGLTRRWGESAETFIRYYQELRELFGERDWEFLKRLSEDFFSDPTVSTDAVLEGQVRAALGMAGSRPIRKFHQDGLMEESAEGILPKGVTIPAREVRDRFIPFTSAEAKLYERIERYISHFYDAYMKGPKAQKPLGFIMTVYRRRLTSSFLAIEHSLRSRREILLGTASAQALLDPDDVAAIEAPPPCSTW